MEFDEGIREVGVASETREFEDWDVRPVWKCLRCVWLCLWNIWCMVAVLLRAVLYRWV